MMTAGATLRLKRFFVPMAILVAIYSGIAAAQPLDDVSLEFQNQGIVATVHLTGPVQYLRHFPESHGKTLEIYYDRVKDATSAEVWLDDEVRKSPPSRLIPAFTVTTHDQMTKPRLVIEFSREAEFSVAAGKDGRSLLITIRPDRQPVSNEPLPFLPTIKPEAKPAEGVTLKPEVATEAQINQEARALMVQGRDALAAKNNDAAVTALNKLLMLPPNDYTQDGQEWIGVARERSGQPDKAKVEYDLYLRLYPDGDGAARVAQRLAGLSGKGNASAPMDVGTEKKQAASLMTFGSVSSRYYYSNSKIDATNTFNNVTTTDSRSQTDQSMLVTTVDASERFRNENYDSRLVFRDTDTRSFLPDQPSRNRVYAAYGEIKGRTQGYLMRVGRQSASGAGVLGRFDGVAGSYGDAQDLRVNAVAGSVVDYSQGSKPKFFGASVDKGAFSFYGVNQTLEGIQDRRAVGTEYRYFDDRKNAYVLLDYDTYFKAVNAAQFMGMLRGGDATDSSWTFMLDHRKSPTLSIRNALNGAATSSISELQQTMSASDLRDLALARTATSNMGQIGVTIPFREKWRMAGDFHLSNTTAMPASGQTLDPVTHLPIAQCTGMPTLQGCISPPPAQGLEKGLTGQLIGSGLRKQGDIWSASLTFSKSDTTSGHSIFFYNHTPISNLWTMDATLMLSSYKYQFTDTSQPAGAQEQNASITQIVPRLSGAYRFREGITFEADCSYQKTKFSGPNMSTDTASLLMSAGLRWDF